MRKATAALAIVAGALALHAVLRSLGPESTALPPYDSDNGIPLLMINARHWDLFHAFYYGQDRFGAWPFLAVHFVSSALRRACTPELLAALLGVWVLSGAVAAMALAPALGAFAALAYLAAVLWPDVTFTLFNTSQPYAWQIVALLWSWWTLRRAAQRGDLRWWLAAALLSFLATWSSRLSGPMLLALVAVELRSVRAGSAVAAGMAGEAGLRAA